jgi:CubicO group peptidase (beta-lactamase class C family)
METQYKPITLTKDDYFPPTEKEGGWRSTNPSILGIDPKKLEQAVNYHNHENYTTSYGGSLIIIYKGHIVAETYVTGTLGGPKPWKKQTCNDIKSSTKSIFGTTIGTFLHEYKDQVNLDTLLVGENRENSLIPQIWDQPITDERKKKIRVKHVLSMTSGHESTEPWLASSLRRHQTGYSGPYQMYEYCFGWWNFEGVPAQHTLLFEPGYGFNYSNFGLEQMALVVRNISSENVGPYTYNRILSQIGVSTELQDNQYKDMPYKDDRELNYSDQPGWGVGGSTGCNAYGADRSRSSIGYNTIVGSTFRCTNRDFARLGYLWLRKGRWSSRQLVPEEWIKKATTRFRQANGETPMNYGYTFWIQDEWDKIPRDTFASRGHNINDCYVIPSLDLVVTRQGNDNPPREQRNHFVKTLLEKIVFALPSYKN